MSHPNAGMLWKSGDLTFCGEKAVKWRSMVVETGPLDASCIGRNQASPAQACKKVAKSLREYLKTRLKQVGDVRAEILVSTFGTDIFEILSGDKAVKELMTVVRLEAVAKDIKQSWDRNQFKRESPFLQNTPLLLPSGFYMRKSQEVPCSASQGYTDS